MGITPHARGKLPPPQVPEQCPQDVWDLIVACSATNPADRPSAKGEPAYVKWRVIREHGFRGTACTLIFSVSNRAGPPSAKGEPVVVVVPITELFMLSLCYALVESELLVCICSAEQWPQDVWDPIVPLSPSMLTDHPFARHHSLALTC